MISPKKSIPHRAVIYLLLLFSVTGVSTAMAQDRAFTLTITPSKPMPDHKVFLYYIKGKDSSGVDSSANLNGKVVMKGKTAMIQQAFYCVARGNSGFKYNYTKTRYPVYLESGNIVVKMDSPMMEAKLGGTKTNMDYQQLVDLQYRFNPGLDSLKGLQRIAYQRQDSVMRKKVSAGFSAIEAEKKQVVEKFVSDHPESFISLEWLENSVNIAQNKAKAAAFFARLSPEIKNSAKGKVYAKKLNSTQSVEIGSIAPEFTSTDLNGNQVSLSAFRGKYVLLDFWASWCVPCRKENPNVIKAYNEFKDKNFTIVGFSLDDAKEPWIRAVQKDGLIWTQLCDTKAELSPVSLMYGVSAIPSNFLIDPQGKIIAKNLRGDELAKKLASFINL